MLDTSKVPELDHFGTCPKCGADWDAGDIFDKLRPQTWCSEKSDDELRAYIETHYSPPYKFSKLIGVEIPHVYDGVHHWMCPDCNATFPRVGRA